MIIRVDFSFLFYNFSSFLFVCVFFLTRLLSSVSGVGERPSLGGLPVTDGHIFRPVCPGEAAGVSKRPLPSQLNGSPPRPAHFESRRRLLRRRQAADARLRPVDDVHGRPALPYFKTEVQSACCCFVSEFFFLFVLRCDVYVRLCFSRLTAVNNGLSLKSLAADLLNVSLDKSLELRCSDWEADQLTLEQVMIHCVTTLFTFFSE